MHSNRNPFHFDAPPLTRTFRTEIKQRFLIANTNSIILPAAQGNNPFSFSFHLSFSVVPFCCFSNVAKLRTNVNVDCNPLTPLHPRHRKLPFDGTTKSTERETFNDSNDDDDNNVVLNDETFTVLPSINEYYLNE